MADAHWPALVVASTVPPLLAYAGLLPRGLGKTPEGGRRLWARIAFAPYFAANAASFWLYRQVARGPALAEVAPNLYLGRLLTAREFAGREWHGVLDLAAEFDATPPARGVARYRSLPVLDGAAPSPAQLAEALAFLAEVTSIGPVYLHCALGHGRSACVAAGYLLARGDVLSVREAVRKVKRLRPGVRLSQGQAGVLGGVERRPL